MVFLRALFLLPHGSYRNKNMKKLFVILATAYSLLTTVTAFAAFAPPTSAPTAGNTEPPLDIGSLAQTKIGDLNLGVSLDVIGKILAESFCFKNGSCLTNGSAGSGSGSGGGTVVNSIGTPGHLAKFKATALQNPTLADIVGDSSAVQFEGKIGIGTLSPITPLHVVASLNIDAIKGESAPSSIGRSGFLGHGPASSAAVVGISNSIQSGSGGVKGVDSPFSDRGQGVYGVSHSEFGAGVRGEASGMNAAAGSFSYNGSGIGNKGYALRTSRGQVSLGGRVGVGYDPTAGSWPALLKVRARGKLAANMYCNESGTICIDINQIKTAINRCGI